MTELTARIALARRKAKPPQWWWCLILTLICLAMVLLAVMRALDGEIAYLLIAGSYACLATIGLNLMRATDPEDDYSLFALLVSLPPLLTGCVACAGAAIVISVAT